MEPAQDVDQDVQISSTEVHLSRPTRQAKTNSRAKTNLDREDFDSDHSLSLLARLVRTTCTEDRTHDLTDQFDPVMDFDDLNFSKARILKLSEDLGRVKSQSIHEGHTASPTDSLPFVLLLTAVPTASTDEPGR
ncbi:hypothetical protein Bca101_026567 [Brassica carinata]